MTLPDGFQFIPAFLDGPTQVALVRELEALAYQHDTFRGRRLKRRYAQFGFAYISTGRRVEAVAPLPDSLATLRAAIIPHCPVGTQFNQCIVTHYPKEAGIGWHTDAPVFGDVIAGVSLGGHGRFQLRPNEEEDVTHELDVGPGSLYIMQSVARWDYQHQVCPVKAVRYSLTFRHVTVS